MDVSVVIVNYNTCRLTCDCLASIYEQTSGVAFEIIVVDNDSSDESREKIPKMFPGVKFIWNTRNLGFGAANNIGVGSASGKYVFFLNSDTILKNNAIRMFFDYYEVHQNEKIGVVGANLYDEKMRNSISYGVFPTVNSTFRLYSNLVLKSIAKTFFYVAGRDYSFLQNRHNPERKFGAVDYISGAAMFCLNDENVLFDTSFFLYYEETDVQTRMEKKGLLRILIDGPEILHLQGGSDSSSKDIYRPISFGSIQSHISAIKYLRKHTKVYGLQVVLLKALISMLLLNPLFLRRFSTVKSALTLLWST